MPTSSVPAPDVDGDVARAQEEELDAVLGVGQHQLAGVAALPVAGLAEHLDGGLGQGALVRDGDPQHRSFSSEVG